MRDCITTGKHPAGRSERYAGKCRDHHGRTGFDCRETLARTLVGPNHLVRIHRAATYCSRFIGGRLQARTKTAIERLTAKIAELAERSAGKTQSESAGAGSAETINAIERLSAKIDQLVEHPVAAALAEGHVPIGADARAAIERLTEGIERLAARPTETSENASRQYALAEIKAAIDALTIRVKQLTASVQQRQNPTAEIETWRREIQQELRDLLQELE